VVDRFYAVNPDMYPQWQIHDPSERWNVLSCKQKLNIKSSTEAESAID